VLLLLCGASDCVDDAQPSREKVEGAQPEDPIPTLHNRYEEVPNFTGDVSMVIESVIVT
jgi:hypothetical protein